MTCGALLRCLNTSVKPGEEVTHSWRGTIHRSCDISIFVPNLPQCGDHFRGVIKVPPSETVDLFLNIETDRVC